MKLTAENREKVLAYAKVFAIVFGIIGLVLFITYKVLSLWTNVEWCLIVAFICVYTGCGTLFLSIISFIVMVLLERGVANETEHVITEDAVLTNLSEEQIAVIRHFFSELPGHRENRDEMNMKEVARFIRALITKGYISSAKSVDFRGLRKWAEDVTHKKAPEQFRFNEAIRNATSKNIDDAVSTLDKLI